MLCTTITEAELRDYHAHQLRAWVGLLGIDAIDRQGEHIVAVRTGNDQVLRATRTRLTEDIT